MELLKKLNKLKKLKVALLSCLLVIVVSGCGTKVNYEVTNKGMCLIFPPIYGHEDDTDGTLDQLEVYMDLYTYFCKEGGINGGR